MIIFFIATVLATVAVGLSLCPFGYLIGRIIAFDSQRFIDSWCRIEGFVAGC